MYKINVDSHVHSILTNHAYSTIEENAIHARDRGIKAIAITDHFGITEKENINNIVASIANRKVLPRKMHDVTIIKGVEIDIIDEDGNLPFVDIPYYYDKSRNVLEVVVSSSEIVIASVHHYDGICRSSVAVHTNMYIKALQNPHINVIGHIGKTGIEFDIRSVLKVAYQNNKAIEINAELLNNLETKHICRKIAEKCAEEGVFVTIGSDAHCAYSIGNFSSVIDLLTEIHFPEELILNTNHKKFMDFFGIKNI